MVVVVAGLGWTTRPEAAFLLVTAVLLSLLPAVYAWWRTTTRRIRPGPVLLLGQSLADLTLVAVLSNYAGPDQPAVVALFVLLIAIYALLLPLIPGGVMVSGGIAAYSISVTQAPGIEVDAAFWGQIVVFLAVYATVAYLGRLLQAAEAGQSALETELLRVRLEAEDILQNISAGILTVDGTGRLGFINPTAEDLLGLDGQGLLGGPVLETLRERSPELHAAIEVGIGEGRRLSRAEGIVTHPDGRRFPIGLSTTTFSRPD
jgi:PAS domain S-box-containing protein